MCRGKSDCTELGNNPLRWDVLCPLRPPEWVDEQISIFETAVEAFVSGQREKCIDLISSTRGVEIRNWFIEHGQISGKIRKDILSIPKPETISKKLRDPERNPRKYQKEVFERDGYRCRYCGIRLISQEFMKDFIKKLGWEGFIKGRTNLERHGIIFASWPVADHVIPWNIGGDTNLDNLVASCGSCNYGKGSYTVEQMGIVNPVTDAWDGLLSQRKNLKGEIT